MIIHCYWILASLPVSTEQFCDLFTFTPSFIQILSHTCSSFTTTTVLVVLSLFSHLVQTISHNASTCIAFLLSTRPNPSTPFQQELPNIAYPSFVQTLLGAFLAADSVEPFLKAVCSNWTHFDSLVTRYLDEPPLNPAASIPVHIFRIVQISFTSHG